ncbi:hypothetical protein RKLH11_2497 [Rhodobacteraceae bacterium KLH11]|nr:hypothetical protein RKLH11_2497 [Rhodobacteraceae bacterium KLH11]
MSKYETNDQCASGVMTSKCCTGGFIGRMADRSYLGEAKL